MKTFDERVTNLWVKAKDELSTEEVKTFFKQELASILQSLKINTLAVGVFGEKEDVAVAREQNQRIDEIAKKYGIELEKKKLPTFKEMLGILK